MTNFEWSLSDLWNKPSFCEKYFVKSFDMFIFCIKVDFTEFLIKWNDMKFSQYNVKNISWNQLLILIMIFLKRLISRNFYLKEMTWKLHKLISRNFCSKIGDFHNVRLGWRVAFIFVCLLFKIVFLLFSGKKCSFNF